MEYRYQKDFPQGLKNVLLPREKFNPLPKYEDEAAWAAVPAKHREIVIQKAEEVLKLPVPRALASSYMKYYRSGVRDYDTNFYGAMRDALLYLTAAECMERKGRFMDALLDHVWALCETTTWVLPAHNWSGLEGYLNSPDGRPLADINDPQIDIIGATLAEYMAWVLYVMRSELDKISYLITERIEYELNKRIVEPFCNRRDEWWITTSTHNWHMWTASNCLAVVLLTETNPAKRAKAAELGLKYTEEYYRRFVSDGSNNEGAGYWVASAGSMYYALKLLQLASNGAIDHFDEPMVKNIIGYIRNTHINGREFYNYSYTTRYNTTLQGLDLYEMGLDVNDTSLMELGAHVYHYDGLSLPPEDHVYPLLRRILYTHTMEEITPKAPNVGFYWSERQQMMIAREKPGTPEGLFLGARGHNGYRHCHRDGGAFILYNNCKPVYIDLGAATYSRAVIDERYRHQHFACVPESHNAVTVNGTGHLPGRTTGAMSEELFLQGQKDNACTHSTAVDNGTEAVFTVDVGHLFPEESGVQRLTRTFTMDRAAGEVRVRQQVECDRESDICLHFMTCEKPELNDGICVGGTKLTYDTNFFTAAVEKFDYEDDPKIRHAWGDEIYRTTLIARAKTLDSTFTISKIAP
ncbi:MAG: heparinase II/III family protein [Clostridia bacterium]|nr:heparinase II/III family protein [Clostridia bacterium]